MNRQTISLALAGSLASALASVAFAGPHRARKDGRQGEMLRHRAQGPERLRRRRRHDMRRHLDDGLPGQCLEGRSQPAPAPRWMSTATRARWSRWTAEPASSDRSEARRSGPPILLPDSSDAIVMAASTNSAAMPCRRAPASASSPSTTAPSSTAGPMSASSRSTPRTTWAPAARRTATRQRSPNTIRCRCTASACRSAATRPLDQAHLKRLKALVDRYRPASSPNISPGRPMTAAFSTICCRCPTPRRRLRASSGMSTRCSRRSACGCCSKTRRPMCCSRRARSTRSNSWRASREKTGCGLLLDVNNVMVSAVNHRLDADRLYRPLPRRAGRRDPSCRL